MSDSGQKFIKRNRPPRVQISYEDPYDAEKQVELPFVMGILPIFRATRRKWPSRRWPSANSPMSIWTTSRTTWRACSRPDFSRDNKLSGEGGEQIGVNLTFKQDGGLHAGRIARQVPALRALLEAREQLANLQRYMDGKVAAEDQAEEAACRPAN